MAHHILTSDQSKFHAAYLAATRPDDAHKERRIFNGHVSMQVGFFRDQAAYLQRIESDTTQKGLGSQALSWLFELADKHRLDVNLLAMPISEGISQEKLIAWYIKNGCQLENPYDVVPTMIRRPRPQPRQTPMPIGN